MYQNMQKTHKTLVYYFFELYYRRLRIFFMSSHVMFLSICFERLELKNCFYEVRHNVRKEMLGNRLASGFV